MMMILPFDPEHSRSHERDKSLRAAEQYELQRALREADERYRAQRKATRRLRIRRYLRLFARRTPPTQPDQFCTEPQ